MSIAYYDANADAFFQDTVHTDVSELRARFTALVPPGGRILDAGCGSGRDAKAFHDAGFRVTAFDASPEMARRAQVHAGIPVTVRTFAEVIWHNEFDGVWACASLLHVPRPELIGAVTRLREALTSHGVLYVSFKYGQADRSVGGRDFTDLNEAGLAALLADVGDLRLIEAWVTNDRRPERQHERWLNALLCKQADDS